jgi:hypothetical protein
MSTVLSCILARLARGSDSFFNRYRARLRATLPFIGSHGVMMLPRLAKNCCPRDQEPRTIIHFYYWRLLRGRLLAVLLLSWYTWSFTGRYGDDILCWLFNDPLPLREYNPTW